MKKHNIKVLACNFDNIKALNNGHTTVEKSRNIQIGDRLRLKEWDAAKGEYTGERMTANVIEVRDSWCNQFTESDEDYDTIKYSIINPYVKK